jgi:D-glycero-alpha-D-manno-heptose 1-phosphate guanylyltransferase
MEAVILAGGRGLRLRSVVPDLPKPMAPILGRPFLEHQLDFWIGQGVGRIILSVGYRREAIQQHFGSRYRGVDVVYSAEEHPLGTGGGLLLATGRLMGQGAFLVVNGDTFFDVDLDRMRRFHDEKRADVTVAVSRVAENTRYGAIRMGEDERIASFQTRMPDPENHLINGGVYLVAPKALANDGWAIGDTLSLEDRMFPTLLSSGCRFHGFLSSGTFIDIGIPEDYRAAESLLASHAPTDRLERDTAPPRC